MIDAHAHISDTDYGNINLYLQQLNQAGLTEGIAVAGGMVDVRKMTDYITGRSQPDNIVPDNEYVSQCIKNNIGTLKGFICINPHDEHSLETLHHSRESGYQGLKLSPLTHQFSFASKAIKNLVECCETLSFPVYSHVLYNPGASTTKFFTLAKEFPNVNFILGHMGFGPADQEGLEAAQSLDNFFLETSTGNFIHIKEAVQRVGPGKIIFGSEFPLSHPKIELEKILMLDLSSDDLDKILGENIKSLLPEDKSND